ncbi:hypothetical protein CTAYLR_006219 [Chrysophaeum taylorii]|uniref:Alpha-type protein kinase domain-containing protein n=1 Tax=Chrysophaeum taylorii TaxID=2483200 RepID=A0AAD7U6L6_9STRA|nr:hypothetical protein CTAYLR_006219 [Chrysophaeum taylorii]
MIDAIEKLSQLGLDDEEMATSEVPLVSHAHGRMRRIERQIERRELQAAVKYGRKERANPGVNGEKRWRFTHKGVVYVTDETCTHEVTSWRIDTGGIGVAAVADDDDESAGARVVLVVDDSGSMRTGDCPGYATRTAAVYDCLAKDLVQPQLHLGGREATVTLIEMSDDAKIVFEDETFTPGLAAALRRRMTRRARSHGNYLPALDAVVARLAAKSGQKQLFLMFLSDGSPSDHVDMACEHDVQVWQPRPYGALRWDGKPQLRECSTASACRDAIRNFVRKECVKKIQLLGDLVGRDRIFVGTVAFGPPTENYSVLQQMAAAVPRSSFQKLGLSAAALETAFTSLTSSLTTLRTSAAAGIFGVSSLSFTKRTDLKKQSADAGREALNAASLDATEFDVYVGKTFLAKKRWSMANKKFEKVEPLGDGVAHAKCYFAEGAERVVFHATEVEKGRFCCRRIGPTLVAKQSLHQELVFNPDYHEVFCRILGEADELACLFNRRSGGTPDMRVSYVVPYVFDLVDDRFGSGTVSVLAEKQLEGRFTKWNNNAGRVRDQHTSVHKNTLGLSSSSATIVEEDEDEDCEEDRPTADDVPQAFSHFTHSVTDGKRLVVDIQGVWNAYDGFVLTDPVIHSRGFKSRNGRTDKGTVGIRQFFETHTCNALCRRLGL